MTCLLLNGTNNLSYKQLKTEPKKNYIIGLDGYPEQLPLLMKLINNYISDRKKRDSGKNYKKNQTGVDFTQTQERDNNNKRIRTARGSQITSTVIKIITGQKHNMNWKTNIVDQCMLT